MPSALAQTKPVQLKPQHREFLRYYMGEARFNATQAAKMAKYSPRSAHTTAAKLLKRADIRAEIGRLQQSATLDTELSYNDFRKEVISEFNKPSRDRKDWADKVMKVTGWGLEAGRGQSEDIPAPIFLNPDDL